MKGVSIKRFKTTDRGIRDASQITNFADGYETIRTYLVACHDTAYACANLS